MVKALQIVVVFARCQLRAILLFTVMQSKICNYTHEIDEHDRASNYFGNPKAKSSSNVTKNGGAWIEQVKHYDPFFLLICLTS